MRDEISVLARLKHPHVVQMLGCSLEPAAIIMERAELGGLDGLLKAGKGKIPLPCQIELMYEMSAGMLYLHGNDVLHRDLKSLNVLLDHGLKVKLADFGLSRVRESTYVRTNAAGTLTHMAPECFEGVFSKKTDVYAFAMTCWEVMTQEWPMRNFPNQAMLMNAVLNKSARPDVGMIQNAAIVELLKRCWHAEADQRPLFDEIQLVLHALKDSNPSTKKQWRDLEDLLEMGL